MTVHETGETPVFSSLEARITPPRRAAASNAIKLRVDGTTNRREFIDTTSFV